MGGALLPVMIERTLGRVQGQTALKAREAKFLFSDIFFGERTRGRKKPSTHARSRSTGYLGSLEKRRPPQVFCPGSRREKVGSPWHSILNLKIILRGPLKVRIRVHPGGWMVGPPP